MGFHVQRCALVLWGTACVLSVGGVMAAAEELDSACGGSPCSSGTEVIQLRTLTATATLKGPRRLLQLGVPESTESEKLQNVNPGSSEATFSGRQLHSDEPSKTEESPSMQLQNLEFSVDYWVPQKPPKKPPTGPSPYFKPSPPPF